MAATSSSPDLISDAKQPAETMRINSITLRDFINLIKIDYSAVFYFASLRLCVNTDADNSNDGFHAKPQRRKEIRKEKITSYGPAAETLSRSDCPTALHDHF